MRRLLVYLALSASSQACLPVSGSRILGRDLALADPRYSALPATLVAAFTAEPGKIRTLAAADLQRLAKANGLSLDNPEELCFEFPMRQVAEEDAVTAMRRVLPAEATLKVIEMQSARIPEGDLTFPLDGLDPAGMWRGYVKYAEARKAPVWARVAITVDYTAVVATTDLPADLPISAASLQLEKITGGLQREIAASSISEVAGRAPARLVKAGAPVPVALLVDPPAIHRGDPVRVEVRSGLARLHFDAIAEAPARKGAIVELRNPLNGKTFKARLDSPSSATIDVGIANKP
jgi:flagella basal body P-ring formation protein FlgA